jgi:hypothetical protein
VLISPAYSKSNPRPGPIPPTLSLDPYPRPSDLRTFRSCSFPSLLTGPFHLHTICLTLVALCTKSVSRLFCNQPLPHSFLKLPGCHPTTPVLELVALAFSTFSIPYAVHALVSHTFPDSPAFFCTLASLNLILFNRPPTFSPTPQGTPRDHPSTREPGLVGGSGTGSQKRSFASVRTAESPARTRCRWHRKSRKGRTRKGRPKN